MCRSRGRNNAVLTSNKTAGCVQTCSNSCKPSRRASQLAPEDPGSMPLLEVFPLSYPSTLRPGQLRYVGYRRCDVSGTFEMLPSSLAAAAYKALIDNPCTAKRMENAVASSSNREVVDHDRANVALRSDCSILYDRVRIRRRCCPGAIEPIKPLLA